MPFTAHPLWLVGFRPFFILACVSGALFPVIWALIFTGFLRPTSWPVFTAMQWHAHEMFYGFGWAVLGGFLLTASKNWVKVRGYHGLPLILLAATWLLERVGMWYGARLPAWLFVLTSNAFLIAIVAMLSWTLIRHRVSDSFRDNHFFLLILPLFIVAKNLLLSADYFQSGVVLTLGLFRVAFLVMLERTLTQFMRNTLQVELLRHPGLDLTIKVLAVILAPAALSSSPLVVPLEVGLALLLALRFSRWKPLRALRRIDIGIMYLGQLAIIFQLLLDAHVRSAPPFWHGSLPTHIFTFGTMGLIIPAMLMRIAKGHTGRAVRFDGLDRGVLWIMITAFLLRVFATQWPLLAYEQWLALAALCWFAAFAILGWRYIPYLVAPRVDGKEH